MPRVLFVFPHQLFEHHPGFEHTPQTVYLIEHPLFFADQQYPMRMHKQKLAYHRATMAATLKSLKTQNINCQLIAYTNGSDPLLPLCKQLVQDSVTEVLVADVHDYALQLRLNAATQQTGLTLNTLPTPGFINHPHHNNEWRSNNKRWFMAGFYQVQRRRLNILMDNNQPEGGQWSFDEDNRKKLPKKLLSSIPDLPLVTTTKEITTAIESVEHQFKDHPGNLTHWIYPVTVDDAKSWLAQFLVQRMHQFGDYEDAIVEDQNTLFHSVLTPMLNVGLLTPDYVVKETIEYSQKYNVPLNSLEGFIRQIIGWREFMRATYEDLGSQMRTTNHWQHTRAMPDSFYDASTGILPVDNTIQRILDTGYCHHIERLMVLGGFMFLCEIHPDYIYQWFMEMFIDSYDWVMVPNVYAMSQNADGGNITTKPYFSGSNYIIKMSHYKKGEWSELWDALFWRWIIKNSEALQGNHRWAMMVRNAQKMDDTKKQRLLQLANDYLANLDVRNP